SCSTTLYGSSTSSLRHPPTSTLFPYTTLFRSALACVALDVPRTWRHRGRQFGQPLGCSPEHRDSLDRAPGHRAFPLLTQIGFVRSEEHTSELQSRENLVCRLLLEKKKSTARHC